METQTFPIWKVMIYAFSLKRDMGHPTNQSRSEQHRVWSSQNNAEITELGTAVQIKKNGVSGENGSIWGKVEMAISRIGIRIYNEIFHYR